MNTSTREKCVGRNNTFLVLVFCKTHGWLSRPQGRLFSFFVIVYPLPSRSPRGHPCREVGVPRAEVGGMFAERRAAKHKRSETRTPRAAAPARSAASRGRRGTHRDARLRAACAPLSGQSRRLWKRRPGTVPRRGCSPPMVANPRLLLTSSRLLRAAERAPRPCRTAASLSSRVRSRRCGTRGTEKRRGGRERKGGEEGHDGGFPGRESGAGATLGSVRIKMPVTEGLPQTRAWMSRAASISSGSW